MAGRIGRLRAQQESDQATRARTMVEAPMGDPTSRRRSVGEHTIGSGTPAARLTFPSGAVSYPIL